MDGIWHCYFWKKRLQWNNGWSIRSALMRDANTCGFCDYRNSQQSLKNTMRLIDAAFPKLGTRVFEKPLLENLHVLTVEADLAVADVLTFILEFEGATVQTATTAKDGLTQLKRSCPNLLICDLALPDLDGYSFIHAARQLETGRTFSLPAIAIAHSNWEIDRQQAIRAGFQQYLFEPIERSSVMAAIARLLQPAMSST